MKKVLVAAMMMSILACAGKKNEDPAPQYELPKGTLDQLVVYDNDGQPQALGVLHLRVMRDGINILPDRATIFQDGQIVTWGDRDVTVGYCELSTPSTSKNVVALRKDKVIKFYPDFSSGDGSSDFKNRGWGADTYNFVAKYGYATINLSCAKRPNALDTALDVTNYMSGEYMTIADLRAAIKPYFRLNRVTPSRIRVSKNSAGVDYFD